MTENRAEHDSGDHHEPGPDLCIAMHGEYKCEGLKGHDGPHYALGGDIEWTEKFEDRQLITDGGQPEGGAGYCEHGSTGPCPDCDGICDRCEERPADPDIAPRTDPELCQECVREIMRESAREGERGQGQRPIGEERALERAERCGSGWPR